MIIAMLFCSYIMALNGPKYGVKSESKTTNHMPIYKLNHRMWPHGSNDTVHTDYAMTTITSIT